MRWRVLLVALLLLPAAAGAAPLPRVASFGLCADEMLLLLGDPQQIASVSAQADGPLSVFADRARGLPRNRGSAEEVIASGARVLLFSDDDVIDKRAIAALTGFGVKVVRVAFATHWGEIDRMTREVAAALGRSVRGEAVIADMHRRLARVAPHEPKAHWPTVVYYRPDGGGAGIGTFVDVALEAAGLRNLQVEWGPPGWGGVPVERVVRHPPDMFAVSFFDTSTDSSSVLRRNPVLWGAARARPVLNVPGKFWSCGSPLLVDAVETLARQRAALHPGRSVRR